MEHNWNDSVSSGASYHTSICTDCGYEKVSSHNIKYVIKSVYKHEEICEDCGYTITVYHSLNYMDDNENHTISCTYCDYFEVGEHNIVYLNQTSTTHTESCERCGRCVTIAHDFEYTCINNDYHSATCNVCNHMVTQLVHVADPRYSDPLRGKHLCRYCGVYYFADITPVIKNKIFQEIIKE